MVRIKIGNYFLIGEDIKERANGSDFIRVEDSKGHEVSYWDKEEFEENPSETLGALLGCLKEAQNKTILQSFFTNQLDYNKHQQKIIKEGNRALSETDLLHWDHKDWLIWESGIEDLF